MRRKGDDPGVGPALPGPPDGPESAYLDILDFNPESTALVPWTDPADPPDGGPLLLRTAAEDIPDNTMVFGFRATEEPFDAGGVEFRFRAWVDPTRELPIPFGWSLMSLTDGTIFPDSVSVSVVQRPPGPIGAGVSVVPTDEVYLDQYVLAVDPIAPVGFYDLVVTIKSSVVIEMSDSNIFMSWYGFPGAVVDDSLYRILWWRWLAAGTDDDPGEGAEAPEAPVGGESTPYTTLSGVDPSYLDPITTPDPVPDGGPALVVIPAYGPEETSAFAFEAPPVNEVFACRFRFRAVYDAEKGWPWEWAISGLDGGGSIVFDADLSVVDGPAAPGQVTVEVGDAYGGNGSGQTAYLVFDEDAPSGVYDFDVEITAAMGLDPEDQRALIWATDVAGGVFPDPGQNIRIVWWRWE